MLSVDEKPTLGKLRILKAANQNKINVIKKISSKWIEFGDVLEFSDDSINFDSIKEKCGNDPEKCCREIFDFWIKGNGVQPCTWGKLIELLDMIDESNLAEEIKNALSPHAN